MAASNDEILAALRGLRATEAEHHSEVRASLRVLKERVSSIELKEAERVGAAKARKPWVALVFAALTAAASAAATWLATGGR